ncbi:MAG: DUF1501 domain-containing protein [Opitutaceae bacterium]
MNDQDSVLNRRAFLRQACCAAVGTTGIVSALSQLKLIGASSADAGSIRRAAADADYKALVCLFLNGGNDGSNVVMPYDQTSYTRYATARGTLAIPRTDVLPLTTRRYADGRTYGMNRDVAGIKALYDQGKIALLANVGTLVRPTTLADYRTGIALPLQLYSHVDQSTQWQSSLPDQPIFQTGWGGRLADLTNAANANGRFSMSISMGGKNYFQVGNTVIPYSVGSYYAELIAGSYYNGLIRERYDALKRMLGNKSQNLLGAAFADETKFAIDDGEYLSDALGRAPTLRTSFPNNNTAIRLQTVARLISMAADMGLKRQVFFVDIDGYDNHTAQAAAHSLLLKELSGAMAAFYESTVELGVANQVTTFTASDFGRTYNPNADGTDHAWGNLQWVMGGAVAGGDIYGTMPSLELGANDDTGRGRWIPTTSVDEYNATLARWFGVSDANMPVVLPNIGRFAKKDLGFMT